MLSNNVETDCMNSTEWNSCRSPEPMLNCIRQRDYRRKLRLFCIACCRRLGALLIDERSQLALETIENFVDGYATDAQLQEASKGAEQVFLSRRLRMLASLARPEQTEEAIQEAGGLFRLINAQAARDAHDAVDNDPAILAASVAWSATATDMELEGVGYSVTDSVIGTAHQAAAAVSHLEDEESEQAELLREIFGNPFQETSLEQRFVTPPIVAAARLMYDSRDFSQMPMLANALEALGCRGADIIEHCRSAAPHVRGCWVIDLILGKS